MNSVPADLQRWLEKHQTAKHGGVRAKRRLRRIADSASPRPAETPAEQAIAPAKSSPSQTATPEGTEDQQARAISADNGIESPALPGGSGGRTSEPSALTGLGGRRRGLARIEQNLPSPFNTIDLSKPGDLALVHRAVCNGWDVPQHIRDQISDQMDSAMDVYAGRSEQQAPTRAGQFRSTRHIIKLVKLMLAMDASDSVELRGYPRSWFPYLRRRRYPEPKRRRRSAAERKKRRTAALERLVEKMALRRGRMLEAEKTPLSPST